MSGWAAEPAPSYDASTALNELSSPPAGLPEHGTEFYALLSEVSAFEDSDVQPVLASLSSVIDSEVSAAVHSATALKLDIARAQSDGTWWEQAPSLDLRVEAAIEKLKTANQAARLTLSQVKNLRELRGQVVGSTEAQIEDFTRRLKADPRDKAANLVKYHLEEDWRKTLSWKHGWDKVDFIVKMIILKQRAEAAIRDFDLLPVDAAPPSQRSARQRIASFFTRTPQTPRQQVEAPPAYSQQHQLGQMTPRARRRYRLDI